jgi:hypothetical protein
MPAIKFDQLTLKIVPKRLGMVPEVDKDIFCPFVHDWDCSTSGENDSKHEAQPSAECRYLH